MAGGDALTTMNKEGKDWKDTAMWWDHDLGWDGWLMMTIGMGGFWILLAVLVFALLRNSQPAGTPGPDAREILRQRFARGEIDAEEYRARLDTLTRASG